MADKPKGETKVVPLDGSRRRLKRALDARPELSPGLHVVNLERETQGNFYARAGDRMVPVYLGGGFEIDFARECLRDARPVLAQVDESGSIEVLGALQTRRYVECDEQSVLHLKGKRIELEASDEAVLRIGKSSLRLDKDGVVRLKGQKLTMDVTAVVRVLSALVELP